MLEKPRVQAERENWRKFLPARLHKVLARPDEQV